MSLDLSAAVEAAAAVDVGILRNGVEFERVPIGADVAVKVIAAAAPLIEAAVREQVAAEIRARIAAEPLLMYVTDWRDGMETAADIAGGTS